MKKLAAALILTMLSLYGEEIWNMETLFAQPRVYPAPGYEFPDDPTLKGIFYDGLPLNGKPTKVFAYLGMPEKHNGKLPGIVLVHGGGGTAFRYWTKLWVKRGYAVIAMDTTGGLPKNFGDKGSDTSIHHPEGGPTLSTVFSGIDLPVEQQWPYHAVGVVIRANTLLRSLPEVDPDRIGMTGISWGAVIGEIAVSHDNRFRFGAMVYGNGFLAESSFWKYHELRQLSEQQRTRWTELWDPASHLAKTEVPLLFCNGVSDTHFRPDSWQKTYRLVKPELRSICYRVKMAHGHAPEGDPAEVAAYADAMVRGGVPLPRFVSQTRDSAVFECAGEVKKAELNYTTDTGDWTKRVWRAVPAKVEGKRVSAEIPADAVCWFFNVYDSRNLIASSEMVTKK